MERKNMKALIGLDRFTDNRPALDLFARIGFADSRITLAYVMPPAIPAGFQPIPVAAGQFEPVMAGPAPKAPELSIEREARRFLERERKLLVESGFRADTLLLQGNPADVLIDEADAIGADLIGATATIQGNLWSALLGSVCRALTIGASKSVLIAKHGATPGKPFSAVLATDHSAYCDDAIDMLLRFNPMGIQRLTVMSAIAQRKAELNGEPVYNPKEILDKTWGIAKKFESLHIQSDALVRVEPVVEAVNRTMVERNADLLIVAAQGHGFIERMHVGSLSLHEAVAEEYSLLILRPEKIA